MMGFSLIVISLISALSTFNIVHCAPSLSSLVNEQVENESETEELDRFIAPWKNKEFDLQLRATKPQEPEFEEFVNSTFAFDLKGLQLDLQDSEEIEENEQDKRAASKLVKEWTVYKQIGAPFNSDVRTLCKYGHNYFRLKHKATPALTYDKGIERSAEKYAIYLASTGKFEHDKKNSKYGENLYRLDNTYDLVATPISAIMAWYEESWITLAGKKEDYDYTWNPKSAAEFQRKGVGHFTQFVWDTTLKFGCGAATTTFTRDGRTWTRTVIVTRYHRPGNILYQFPKHIHPLKQGGTLEGIKRGKLYPVKGCVSTVKPKKCAAWKQYGWCDRIWAKRDCFCTCQSKKKNKKNKG